MLSKRAVWTRTLDLFWLFIPKSCLSGPEGRRRRRRRRRKVYSKLGGGGGEEEEEEESLFKADAVNAEDSERDRATQV